MMPTYRDGTPVPMSDLDTIARAFGFHSARHMDEVSGAREAERRRRRERFDIKAAS